MNQKGSRVRVVRGFSPHSEQEKEVKSRNGCEGLSLFGLGAMQAVPQQLPEQGGSDVV